MSGSESAIPGGALAGKASGPSTLTAAELASFLGIEAPRAATLLEVARLRVDTYAPAAPAAMANEAVRRFAGYLNEADSFGAISQEDIGPLQISRTTNHANAFRNSGAAALLSRWRVRRAGAIG